MSICCHCVSKVIKASPKPAKDQTGTRPNSKKGVTFNWHNLCSILHAGWCIVPHTKDNPRKNYTGGTQTSSKALKGMIIGEYPFSTSLRLLKPIVYVKSL
jgi:hypothetical protein